MYTKIITYIGNLIYVYTEFDLRIYRIRLTYIYIRNYFCIHSIRLTYIRNYFCIYRIRFMYIHKSNSVFTEILSFCVLIHKYFCIYVIISEYKNFVYVYTELILYIRNSISVGKSHVTFLIINGASFVKIIVYFWICVTRILQAIHKILMTPKILQNLEMKFCYLCSV